MKKSLLLVIISIFIIFFAGVPPRVTPIRTVPIRSTPIRSTPIRSTPIRSTPIRSTSRPNTYKSTPTYSKKGTFGYYWTNKSKPITIKNSPLRSNINLKQKQANIPYFNNVSYSTHFHNNFLMYYIIFNTSTFRNDTIKYKPLILKE